MAKGLHGTYSSSDPDGVLSEQEALEEAEKFGVTPLHIQALPPHKHIIFPMSSGISQDTPLKLQETMWSRKGKKKPD